jgi:RNA polymerase sigma factor (sigma-70 family)
MAKTSRRLFPKKDKADGTSQSEQWTGDELCFQWMTPSQPEKNSGWLHFFRDARGYFPARWTANHGGSHAEVDMSHPALSTVVARASLVIHRTSEPESTDGALLSRFIQTKDEAAFAELVGRLGPMVLGVCRRITGDCHLAEDAFQAVFLVLARRAKDVRPREALRGWLYGVAVRTARGARAVSARRRLREVNVSSVPECTDQAQELPDTDVLRLLDEEVGALPDHLRVVVVLCELEGVSRNEVARRLHIPEGTLSSRLAKARKLLARRLLKRGVVLPSVGLGSLGLAAEAVPARLAKKTSALASTIESLSPLATTLANGVIRTVFLQKLKLTATCLLFLALTAIAAINVLPSTAAKGSQRLPVISTRVPQQTQEEKKSQPPAKPAGAGTLLLARHGECWVLTSNGKRLPDLPIPDNTDATGRASLSPDGTQAAFIVEDIEPPSANRPEDKPWPFKIIVRKFDDPKTVKEWEMPSLDLDVCWTADGKHLIVSKLTSHTEGTCENMLLDPTTGKTEKLDLPTDGRILDSGRDGKTFLVKIFDPKTKSKTLALVVKGEDKIHELCKLNDRRGSTLARLSQDGKKVLFTDADPDRKDFHKWGISQRPYLLDAATKKREPLPEFPENGQASGIAWSPDGQRIAYTWRQLHEDVYKKDTIEVKDIQFETEGFLMIADADGKNAKTIITDKVSNAINPILGTIDWR